MSPADFFQAIRDSWLATSVRESALLYPIILSLHLTSIAVFGGMILMTDLRLLGWALNTTPAAEVIRQLRVWKRLGFVVMVTWRTGIEAIHTALMQTPETVERQMISLASRWLAQAGAVVDAEVPVEISPLLAQDAAELARRIPAGLHVTEPRFFC